MSKHKIHSFFHTHTPPFSFKTHFSPGAPQPGSVFLQQERKWHEHRVWQCHGPFQILICPPGHSSICSFVHSSAHCWAGTGRGAGFYPGLSGTKLASGVVPMERPSRGPHYHPKLRQGERGPRGSGRTVHLMSTFSPGSCWGNS